MKPGPGSLAAALSALLTGCGGASPSCVGHYTLSVFPVSATADSAGKAPGDQQQFRAEIGQTFSNPYAQCAVPAVVQLAYPAWNNPDPLHIDISSASDSTNGLATCKGPTAGSVALTASTTAADGTTLSTSVALTCK